MCHACVIDSVKERGLGRRDLFRAAAIGGAGAAAAMAMPPKAMARAPTAAVDLTHELHQDFPTYFGEPGISFEQTFNFAEHGFNLNMIQLNEHTGTHLDAPIHFSEDGQTCAEIPVGNLICPLAVVDIRTKAAGDAEAQVTPDDLSAWIAEHGDIPDRACVAMLSGWAERAAGDGFRNADADGVMRFPGFHVEAAQMLIEQTAAVGMAVDTLSLDIGSSTDFATHYAWLPTNRWGLECVAGLEGVPAAGATLFVGVPKTRGGSGGPTRAIALV